MIAKKYFSALIIMITLLGFYKEQLPTPNQQIELQFTGQTTVPEEGGEVIEAIKLQLEALGVENIQVRQSDGILKIAYYSDENVAEIKKILATEGFDSDSKSEEIPTNKKPIKFQDYGIVDSFKIDIYELQIASNPFSGIHGKYILALQKNSDKSPDTNPNSFANANSFLTGEFKTIISLAYTESTYIAIPKENISYEIPDVRAGPFSAMRS
jgi:hypothetical protein